jgi:excisionase family DNA binding protein
MTKIETPYANISKVAEYFRVSVSTVRKWVHSGQIPADTYIRIGEVYRFRMDDVEAALTATPKEAQVSTSTTKNDGE